MHKIDPIKFTSPLCPLCSLTEHTTNHLFNCSKLPTNLTPLDLWNDPVRVVVVLEAWELRSADSEKWDYRGCRSDDNCSRRERERLEYVDPQIMHSHPPECEIQVCYYYYYYYYYH